MWIIEFNNITQNASMKVCIHNYNNIIMQSIQGIEQPIIIVYIIL